MLNYRSFTNQLCAENSEHVGLLADQAAFRLPLGHVDLSAMMHQMKLLGAASTFDDPEGLSPLAGQSHLWGFQRAH